MCKLFRLTLALILSVCPVFGQQPQGHNDFFTVRKPPRYVAIVRHGRGQARQDYLCLLNSLEVIKKSLLPRQHWESLPRWLWLEDVKGHPDQTGIRFIVAEKDQVRFINDFVASYLRLDPKASVVKWAGEDKAASR